eukprot:CAMPEP_0197845634 /NCGR_PEP_ID=MMETSP1438-20131217/2541_1 /TAXON_ID=1461541 /ORGANISM="Pterosperma sp., Strain CCMP1384" /LENGTH=507 /DNA_ID=CAMNT_0043457007 /DNA_START=214 /DNA_END=1737 /DNA_ORIENTATION=+
MTSTTDAVGILKDSGNQLFRTGKLEPAVEKYSQALQVAISLEPGAVTAVELSTIFSNRSASYLKLGKAEAALADADKCIELRPDWEKGYFRRGQALEGIEDYEKALSAYQEASGINPTNKEVQQKIRGLQKTVRELQSRQFKVPGGVQAFLKLAEKTLPSTGVQDLRVKLEASIPRLYSPEVISSVAEKVVSTAHACALLELKPFESKTWTVVSALENVYPDREHWKLALDVFEEYRVKVMKASRLMPFVPDTYALLKVVNTYLTQPKYATIFPPDYVRQALAVLNNEVITKALKAKSENTEVYTKNHGVADLQRLGGVENLLELASRYGSDEVGVSEVAQEAVGVLHNFLLPALTSPFHQEIPPLLMDIGTLFDRPGNPLVAALSGAGHLPPESQHFWDPLEETLKGQVFQRRHLEITMRLRVLALQLVEDSSGGSGSSFKVLVMLKLLRECSMHPEDIKGLLGKLTTIEACKAFVSDIEFQAKQFTSLLEAFTQFGYKKGTPAKR